MATDKTKDIKERIEAVSASNKKLLKKRNKIDYIAFGGIGVLCVILAIISGFAGNWETVLINAFLLLWLGWILVLNLQFNQQRFVIDMFYDLRDLERQELDELLANLEKNANKAVEDLEKKVTKKKAAKA